MELVAGEPKNKFSVTVFVGVCLLSKLSQLKQDAYQAGKKKDWDQAVSIYEKILELEKNNPTAINEMGDLCLKAGESGRAVSHFLKAASKYRKTGLLNNAVAIYKKILRHDDDNINAHWYLAETRSSQGLIQEGEVHGIKFLTSSEDVSGELKEIFLSRCRELFELFPENQTILDNLLKIFRTWDMGLEASRTLCLLACVQYDAGNEEEATQGMSDVVNRTPEITNYPEFTKWNNKINPVPESNDTFNDFGSVSFDDSPAEIPVTAQTLTEEPVVPAQETSAVSLSDETSFGGLQTEVDKLNSEPEQDGAKEPDDDGCFSLDTGEGLDFEDLLAQAADGLSDEDKAPKMQVDNASDSSESAGPGMDSLLASHDHSKSGDVDLLAEILAEDSEDMATAEADQLDTISKEIGAQVGGDDEAEDADRLYEMGLVYLEMGLFDQACESLEKATADPEFTIRAYEMWGMALSRDNRPDEAVVTLSAGLEKAEAGSQEYLGLLYHIARAHEQAERPEQALEFYEKIQNQDRSYLDVGKRMASLATV